MDKVKRLFRNYLFSSMLILLGFLFVNTILLLVILLFTSNISNESLTLIEQMADCIDVDRDWNISVDKNMSVILNDMSAWGMVLDDNGNVIWEDSMPEQLPRHYTASDIAQFSRWYLDDYPVLIQILSKGILVVGCSPNSITKLNYTIDTNVISPAIYGGVFVIIANILLVLLLFWNNIRKVEKATIPILNSIFSLVKGKPITLPQNSELAEINTELNRASEFIIKKDKARADWINGVSHDIRTPLSIMLGYAAEIEDSQSLAPVTRKKAELIRKNGEKLRQLISDLNLASRLEYAMQPLNVGAVYPVELAREVISEFFNNGLDDKYQIGLEAASDLDSATRRLFLNFTNADKPDSKQHFS